MAAEVRCTVTFHQAENNNVTELFSYLIGGVEWDLKPGTGVAVVFRLVGDGPELESSMFLNDAGPAAAAKDAQEALQVLHQGLRKLTVTKGWHS